MSRLMVVSILVTVILIGIPTAASFYPPIFAGLADRLPINFILTWMARMGILALGAMGGWFARGIFKDDSELERQATATEEPEENNETETNITEIEGCIEVEGSCWRGTAELSDEEISDIEIQYKAICPKCQTVMYDGENSTGVAVIGGGPNFWKCPSCDHQTMEQYSKYENAQNLFESHVRRIVETQGEEYSLDNIVEEIGNENTPRDIWRRYFEVMDDDQVSMNCFH